jgi:endonuclease YncB( thermonuclease family)
LESVTTKRHQTGTRNSSKGKTVELQRGNRDEDVYGCLLRYVYEVVFVNAELIVEGYASTYIVDTEERYSRVLLQLEQYAKLSKQVIWGL